MTKARTMIYLDILFLMNWIVDYLILALIKQDFFPYIRKRKVIAGSLIAASSYLLWFYQAGKVSNIFLAMEAVFFISLVLLWTFSIKRFAVFCKTALAAFFYAFLMGGGCYALKNILSEKITYCLGQWREVVSCLLIYIFCSSVGRRLKKDAVKMKECTYEVEIQRKGRAVCLLGLYDSGNLLKNQWTGEGICILSMEAAEGLFDQREKEILTFLLVQKDFPWKIMTDNLWSGIYRISYSSVGKEEGWMPGITADQIIVKKDGEVLAERKGLLGITAQQILREKKVGVLLPADIFVT